MDGGDDTIGYMSPETFDARRALVSALKDRIREHIRDEVEGTIPTANFLKIGTREPVFNPETLDSDIPDSDWEVFADVETGSLVSTIDERWVSYVRDLNTSYQEFARAREQEGVRVTIHDFPRYYLRAFLANLLTKKQKERRVSDQAK